VKIGEAISFTSLRPPLSIEIVEVFHRETQGIVESGAAIALLPIYQLSEQRGFLIGFAFDDEALALLVQLEDANALGLKRLADSPQLSFIRFAVSHVHLIR
jgi:hypothetical protein